MSFQFKPVRILALGLMILLFEGCYTSFVTQQSYPAMQSVYVMEEYGEDDSFEICTYPDWVESIPINQPEWVQNVYDDPYLQIIVGWPYSAWAMEPIQWYDPYGFGYYDHNHYYGYPVHYIGCSIFSSGPVKRRHPQHPWGPGPHYGDDFLWPDHRSNPHDSWGPGAYHGDDFPDLRTRKPAEPRTVRIEKPPGQHPEESLPAEYNKPAHQRSNPESDLDPSKKPQNQKRKVLKENTIPDPDIKREAQRKRNAPVSDYALNTRNEIHPEKIEKRPPDMPDVPRQVPQEPPVSKPTPSRVQPVSRTRNVHEQSPAGRVSARTTVPVPSASGIHSVESNTSPDKELKKMKNESRTTSSRSSVSETHRAENPSSPAKEPKIMKREYSPSSEPDRISKPGVPTHGRTETSSANRPETRMNHRESSSPERASENQSVQGRIKSPAPSGISKPADDKPKDAGRPVSSAPSQQKRRR